MSKILLIPFLSMFIIFAGSEGADMVGDEGLNKVSLASTTEVLNFESGSLSGTAGNYSFGSYDFAEQGDNGARYAFISITASQGSKSLGIQHDADNDGSWDGSKLRTEVYFLNDVAITKTYYWRFDFRLSSAHFRNECSNGFTIVQIEEISSPNGPAVAVKVVGRYDPKLEIRWEEASAGERSAVILNRRDFTFNTFHKVLLKVKPNAYGRGKLKVWADSSTAKLNKSRFNLGNRVNRNGNDNTGRWKVKFGQYGKPDNRHHHVITRHDRIKVCDTRSSCDWW